MSNTRAIHISDRSMMTEEQFREWIRHIDQNKDGRISQEELKAALRVLGLRFKRLRAWWAIKKSDANHNGCIDTESEIQALMEHAKKHWGFVISSN